MIDIHCHIIPSVDDGSQNLSTSMMMAAMSADSDVDTVIATPHLNWENGVVKPSLAFINEAFSLFSSEIQKSRIPIKIVKGGEVLCVNTDDTEAISNGFPTIENTNYALTEFFFDTPIKDIDRSLHNIASKGIRPIIAHPERYYSVQRDKKAVKLWREEGFLIQVNKNSVLGDFGRKIKSVANWMLDNELITAIASDAHGIHSRNTSFTDIFKLLKSHYGEDVAIMLLNDNPAKIIANESF